MFNKKRNVLKWRRPFQFYLLKRNWPIQLTLFLFLYCPSSDYMMLLGRNVSFLFPWARMDNFLKDKGTIHKSSYTLWDGPHTTLKNVQFISFSISWIENCRFDRIWSNNQKITRALQMLSRQLISRPSGYLFSLIFASTINFRDYCDWKKIYIYPRKRCLENCKRESFL